jgi:hypothetical protein
LFLIPHVYRRFFLFQKNSLFAAKHWANGSLNYGPGCAFGVLNGVSMILTSTMCGFWFEASSSHFKMEIYMSSGVLFFPQVATFVAAAQLFPEFGQLQHVY